MMPGDYYFSIAAATDCHVVGEVDGGARLDLTYSDLDGRPGVRTNPDKLPPLAKTVIKDLVQAVSHPRKGEDALVDDHDLIRRTYTPEMVQALGLTPPEVWYGIEGELRSGRDWLLVGNDGVLEFDGRITIVGNDGFVVGAHILGRADLTDLTAHVGGNDVRVVTGGARAYALWKQGLPAQSRLHLALPIIFDVADDTASALAGQGLADTGASVSARYVPLGRNVFVGLGSATFRGGPCSHLERIELDVYRLA